MQSKFMTTLCHMHVQRQRLVVGSTIQRLQVIIVKSPHTNSSLCTCVTVERLDYTNSEIKCINLETYQCDITVYLNFHHIRLYARVTYTEKRKWWNPVETGKKLMLIIITERRDQRRMLVKEQTHCPSLLLNFAVFVTKEWLPSQTDKRKLGSRGWGRWRLAFNFFLCGIFSRPVDIF